MLVRCEVVRTDLHPDNRTTIAPVSKMGGRQRMNTLSDKMFGAVQEWQGY